jgi:hypothetical protein
MQKKHTVIMCPKNMTITVKDFVNGCGWPVKPQKGFAVQG